jgi:hypothetical protein
MWPEMWPDPRDPFGLADALEGKPCWHGRLAQLQVNVQELADGLGDALAAGDDLKVAILLAGVSGQLKSLAAALPEHRPTHQPTCALVTTHHLTCTCGYGGHPRPAGPPTDGESRG